LSENIHIIKTQTLSEASEKVVLETAERTKEVVMSRCQNTLQNQTLRQLSPSKRWRSSNIREQ